MLERCDRVLKDFINMNLLSRSYRHRRREEGGGGWVLPISGDPLQARNDKFLCVSGTDFKSRI